MDCWQEQPIPLLASWLCVAATGAVGGLGLRAGQQEAALHRGPHLPQPPNTPPLNTGPSQAHRHTKQIVSSTSYFYSFQIF